MKFMVLESKVMFFGISRFLNVVIEVCFVLMLVMVCFLIVLIIWMLWLMLMVKIKKGINIDMGFMLKFNEVNNFNC